MDSMYPVRNESPNSPPDIPVDLLKGLATALSGLGPVFATDLATLTGAEMERALNSLEPKHRSRVMRNLGFRQVVPRRFGTVLTEQILKRLRARPTEVERKDAIAYITWRIRHEIEEEVFSGEPGTDARDLVGRWGPTLLRIAVFCDVDSSALHAHLVRWLAEKGWLGDAPEGRAARDAACAVIDAIPGFGAPAPATDMAAAQTAGLSALPLPEVTASPEAADQEPAAPPAPEGNVLMLTTAREQLTRALAQARPAAQQVRDAVEAGFPPDEGDLDTLRAVSPAFHAVEGAFDNAGVARPPRSLEAVATAVDAHVRTAREQEAARRALDSVLALRCPQGGAVADVLDDARSRADSLLGKQTWDDRDREEAAFLALLAELVELRDQPQQEARRQEIMKRIGEGNARYAVAAVLHEQITLASAAPEVLPSPDAQPVVPGPPASDALEPDPGRPGSGECAEAPEESAVADGADSGMKPEPGMEAGALDILPGDPSGTVPTTAGSTDRTEHSDAPPGSEPAAGTDASDTSAGSGHERSESHDDLSTQHIDAVLARLIEEKRFGLGAHISRAAARPESESGVLRMSAVSALLTSRSRQAALALELELRDWEPHEGSEPHGVALLMLPVLVRTALLTGLPVAGAHLKAMAPQLPENLQTVATAVAERALSTALLSVPPHTVISDVSQTENRLREAVESCRAQLSPPRMNFQRASRMAQQWLKPHKLLGSVLTSIVQGSSAAEAQAEQLLEKLASRARIESLIDEMDTALRGSGGARIDGVGRTCVRQLLERVRDSVGEWRSARRELAATPTQANAWAYEAVTALRQDLLTLKDRVDQDLVGAARSTTPLTRASALHAKVAFGEIFTELQEGIRPQGTTDSTLTVDDILDSELHKVERTPGRDVDASDLLLAVDRTWDEAVELQVRRDGFAALRRVIELADAGVLPERHTLTLDGACRTSLAEQERGRHQVLTTRASQLAADLRRAQADGTLTVEQDVRLQETLADAELRLADSERCDLIAVRAGLDQVAELLPGYRREAADRLLKRLDSLTGVTDADRDRVLHNVKIDNLAVAAELVYFLELGESVPEVHSQDSHLEAFFPGVPEALPHGLGEELIEAVCSRSRYEDHPLLDYAHLTEEEAAHAASALRGWHKIASVRSRGQINPREDLNPALLLLGYGAKRARPLTDLPYGKDHRFFELAEVEVTGRAWAPAFGSQIADNGRKLRALLVWDRPTAEFLHACIAKDRDDSSLLVVYFGTMSARTRNEFAVAARGGRPVVVVDDAALAYLVAHGNRRADASTKVLLPFSAVNPYIKEKRGRIGWEMFYGRDAERQSIIAHNGTQIIYGGRGLGKSALLADAGERFERQRPDHYRKLYLNLDKVGISSGTAIGSEAIWPTLERALIQVEVLAEPTHRERGREAWRRVTDGIARWLEQDSGRRLLVLLDECDRFFEADAPEFTETRRLRGLGEDSPGRAKVVFAGLHSVQRFTRIAGNTPFSHLAQTPTVIGPLTPQFAADLLVEPMRALGFEFDDLDLVNRVLGFCSYQPFLLQIFGSRMVQVMQAKRVQKMGASPPYFIGEDDVEAVEQDASLRSDITAAFKDTLDLDDRYTLIANVLAQHARDNGLETRLSDRELHDECAVWWPQGFEQLHSNAFRTYLEEMVGLGVLAPNHDGRGWHLRGPNALRMIGTAQEIEARLEGAERDSRLEDAVVLESRPLLRDGRSAPLTISQIDYLLGNRKNQVRVVLGSRATGIEEVEQTLRGAAGQVEGWTVPVIGSANSFRRAVEADDEGDRRLLISDLTQVGTAKSCRESLALAQEMLPAAQGATRSVVLVSGTNHLDLWQELATTQTEGFDMSGVAVVLRRYDARDMKRWAQQHSVWETDERLDRLGRITSGWPILLGEALKFHGRCRDQDRALDQLDAWLGSRSGAEELVDAVGVLKDERIRTAYFAIVRELGLDWSPEEDCQAAGELAGLGAEESRGAVSCLSMLHTLEEDGSRLRPDAVLHAAMATLGLEG